MRFACYRLHILLSGALALNVSIVLAQDYPTRPVRLITSGIGGGTDFSARMIAQGLTEAPLGQPVVVDNRSSAQASDTVSKAPPDGHVLLLVAGNLWIGPLLTKMPYDPIKDFVAISITNRSPNILAVHPSLPVKTVKDLIALGKARPGELNYGSSSIGGTAHLAAELFQHMAGIRMVRVNYKSSTPVVNDLIGGHIQLTFSTAGVTTPHLKSGRLKALAVTTSEPSPMVPGVPAIAATLPGYEAAIVYGLFAPAGTPAGIVTRLSQAVTRYLGRADAKEKFFNAGLETVGTTPEQTAAYIKADMARMGKVIKDAGIKVD
jgi:tripartite-type tricarboxylate transporter receptor subunit TctC